MVTIMPEGGWPPGKPWLTFDDVRHIFGQAAAGQRGDPDPQAADPIPARTLVSLIARYSPDGRWPTHAMPAYVYPNPDRAARGQNPIWMPVAGEDLTGLETRLQNWYVNGRVGRGVGGGRKPRKVICDCGCGQLIARGAVCDRQAAGPQAGAKRRRRAAS